MTDLQNNTLLDNEKERALLVGVNINRNEAFDREMEELANLAGACHMEVAAMIIQNLPMVHQSLYIGTGKVEEVRETAQQVEAGIIIFEGALSPTQLRNLQKELQLPILDRTTLILDIFSTRAKTREAKMQVEVARLQYMLPRLVGLHAALGRQGGGSGLSNKGAGEKKLELDKRKISARIQELKNELTEVARERETQRKLRASSGIPRVALVGYTNAGKSTLMNACVEEYVKDDTKKVYVEDMLFATLDTTVRKITAQKNKTFLLSDTVGFINKLPHNLVKAFHSTLEEVREADLLLHVIDFSDGHFKEHIKVTKETLEELGAGEIPVIYVYNKADLNEEAAGQLPIIREDKIYMSAKSKTGLEELIRLIQCRLFTDYVSCKMLLPFEKGGVASYFMEHAVVDENKYQENGIFLSMQCRRKDYEKYKEYVIEALKVL